MGEHHPASEAHENGMNGQDWHVPEDDQHTTIKSAHPLSPAGTIPLVFTPADEDPGLFILVSPKGACSITHPASVLPGTKAFGGEIFDITARRTHGYENRPKGDRGPSGEGWTGIYVRVDPIYDGAERARIEQQGGRGWSMGVEKDPVEGLKEGLVITGSDDIAAIYALHLITEAMGLSPWHRWQTNRPPWKPHVAIKRTPRIAGTLPPLGQVFSLDQLPQDRWESLATTAEERDGEENLDNIIWTAVKLGNDSISYKVLEYLKITDQMSREKIEARCKRIGIKLV